MGSNYAGVDWASEKHDVLVADETGEELLSATFAHDEKGLRSLCRALVRLDVGLVAIERPDGVLVERLLDAGLRVLALHPNQVAAARPRFRVSGGKSDRFDSFVLCELARTDSHRFRVLEPDSDLTKALRALTRGREDLVQTRVALTNQLRAELERCWPGAIRIFDKLDSPIALAFLLKYPSPIDARALGEKRLAAFLAKHGYSGGKTAAQLLGKLRSAPEGRAGEPELIARRQLVSALVAALGPLVRQIKVLDRQIATAVREHPDGEIFLSLFKDPRSVITAATLLAEIGDCRARYPTREALAGDAGQGAIAVESGKRKVACFRWACNKRLRGAFGTLADSTRHWHPWAADHYASAIARGHDHPRAIRTLGRAWCRVVWRCWHDGTPYDPARHRALQQHVSVTIPGASGPRPDTAATQRMLGTAVTSTAARRAEREALDGKPTTANTPGG
ncbi:MAG TPA: IS110 family transposase [Solirubrobacteraceae bacterium]|nr:IS110 family transposase [Solirubrobacteraceae bacterium]